MPQFPEGALTETVTLIIERYFGECLPTDAPQYQGCYKFRTEPHIENFELPATVGVCLFDPAAPWVVDDHSLLSQGKDTPYHGRELLGRALMTLVGGRIVYERPGLDRTDGSD